MTSTRRARAAANVSLVVGVLGVLIAAGLYWQRDGFRDDAEVDHPGASENREPRRASLSVDDEQLRGAATANVGVADVANVADLDCEPLFGEALQFAEAEKRLAGAVADVQPRRDWTAELTEFRRTIEQSRDPEHLLTEILLAEPRSEDAAPADAAELERFAALAAESRDPKLAWHALRICSALRSTCPYIGLEQRLLDVDRHNAEAWALVAESRHERGDFAGALTALERAAVSSTATMYWVDTIEMIDRTLGGLTALPSSERASSAIGTTVVGISDRLVTMCSTEVAGSRDWFEACVAFGSLRVQHQETEMAQILGYAIREKALVAMGETERAAASAAERERARNDQRAWRTGKIMQFHSALVESSAARMESYIELMRLGEIEGLRRFLEQEVPLLFRRAGLDERSESAQCLDRMLD